MQSIAISLCSHNTPYDTCTVYRLNVDLDCHYFPPQLQQRVLIVSRDYLLTDRAKSGPTLPSFRYQSPRNRRSPCLFIGPITINTSLPITIAFIFPTLLTLNPIPTHTHPLTFVPA
jgi:hypothetical protein